MLQGPVGPFFNNFKIALKEAGFNPIKINFNGGDWLFAHGENVINFRGTAAEWGEWFADFLKIDQPEFIILMGDERPLHATAIRIAGAEGIPVWVLEEGYIRPDYITCELNGVNANSPIALGAGALSSAEDSPAPSSEFRAFKKNAFVSMAVYATFYYYGLAFGKLFFPRYVHYRNRSLISEFFLWTRNSYRKLRNLRANNKSLLELLEHHDKSYFLVALQVSDDMQLVAHGRGWTVDRLITSAIRSFSLYAGPDDLLVFKGHPLDRGHFPHGDLIREIAKLADCEDRVRFLDDGSIGLLIRHAKGVVAVNSTSGLSALHHGTPLLCLGEALYKQPGLVTFCNNDSDMDAFWCNPTGPDIAVARQFLDMIRRKCLINGTFYNKASFPRTFRNLLKKLEQENGPALKELARATIDRDVHKDGNRGVLIDKSSARKRLQ